MISAQGLRKAGGLRTGWDCSNGSVREGQSHVGCCTRRMGRQHPWSVLNECAKDAMHHVVLGVSAVFHMDVCERGGGGETSRIAESIHLSYVFTPAGELEVTFPPVSSTDAVWLALGSVADCEEWHGQVFESMCFVLTDRLLQALWHKVKNGSVTAEGICPSWRCEFFPG